MNLEAVKCIFFRSEDNPQHSNLNLPFSKDSEPDCSCSHEYEYLIRDEYHAFDL